MGDRSRRCLLAGGLLAAGWLAAGCTPRVSPPPVEPVPAPAPAPEPALPAPAPTDGSLAPPFSPEQIRDAMPVGTRIVYRIGGPGRAAVEERWEVTAADAQSCTIASRVVAAEGGALVEDQGSGTSTWGELAAHAVFPAARTTVEAGSVTVPAGTFETRRFVVSEGNGTVRVFDFAPALPGPPVRLVTTVDGQVSATMELVSREPMAP